MVPPKDNSKNEACAVMKHPDAGKYYVIRRQLASLQTQINIKLKAGYSELLTIKNPNSVNLLVRVKERFSDKVKVCGNTVVLLGISER